MLKKVLLVVGAILVAILVLAAFQPTDYKVTRMETIAATHAEVFPQVNNFQAWTQWSPWEKLDTNLQKSFEGPQEGEGAIYTWKGDHNVGVGKMAIAKSQTPEKVVINMTFIEPMPGDALVEFDFKPVEAGTLVTWSISGKNNYLSRIMCLFMNMDKMIGSNFEKGLANLKSLVEASKKSN